MSCDAIVIGGGFAGLSAATALAEAGRRVLLLEARRTLGGRASTFTDPATGERVDNGQHVLAACYDETFRFLRRIDAMGNVQVEPRLALPMVDAAGCVSTLTCPDLPAPLHLVAGLLTWRALGWRDRLAVLRVGPALLTGTRSAGHAGVDRETVYEWLVRRGQTPRLIECLWEPFIVAALNQPVRQASMAALLPVLRQMLRSRRDTALALPLVPLDALYVGPARRFLEQSGSTVRVNARARVAFEGPRGRETPVVVVGDQLVRAPTVIAAVPWHALPDLLPEAPGQLANTIDAARHTPASPIVTVNLWFDRVVTTTAFVGLPGRTMQWVFDKRMVFGESASHLSLVSSGAADVVARSSDELTALALAEVRGALPAARDAQLRRAVVVREKRATFSVAPGMPGRPGTVTGISGLLLAGDWIGTGLPATIEGAVVSGHRAAAAALAEASDLRERGTHS